MNTYTNNPILNLTAFISQMVNSSFYIYFVQHNLPTVYRNMYDKKQ